MNTGLRFIPNQKLLRAQGMLNESTDKAKSSEAIEVNKPVTAKTAEAQFDAVAAFVKAGRKARGLGEVESE